MKKHHAKQNTVRLTIDFPADQHTYIKMLAAKQGISLRQFVLNHLPTLHEEEEGIQYVPEDEFNKLLKDLLNEKADVLESLSKR